MANTNQNTDTQKSERQKLNFFVKDVHSPDPNDPSKNYFDAVFYGEENNPDAQVFRVRMNMNAISMEQRKVYASKAKHRGPCTAYIKAEEAKKYKGVAFSADNSIWNAEDGCFEVRYLLRLGSDPVSVVTGPAVAQISPDKTNDNRLRIWNLHFLQDAVPVDNPSVVDDLCAKADEHFSRRTHIPRTDYIDPKTNQNYGEIIVHGQKSFGVILVAQDAQGQVLSIMKGNQDDPAQRTSFIMQNRTPKSDSEWPEHYTDERKYRKSNGSYAKDKNGGLILNTLPIDGQYLAGMIEDFKKEMNQTFGNGIRVLAIPVVSYPGSQTAPPLSKKPFDRDASGPFEPIEAIYKGGGYTCRSVTDLPVDQNNQVLIGGKVDSAFFGLVPIDATCRKTQDQVEGLQSYINGSNLTVSYPLKDEQGLIKHPIECVKGPDGQPLQLHPALRGLVVARDRTGNYTVAGYQQTFAAQQKQAEAEAKAQQQAVAQQPATQAPQQPYNPALDHAAANVAPLDPNEMLNQLDQAAAGSAREQAAAAPMQGEHLPAQAPAAQRPVYNNAGPGA
ncbi:MAG: hypothetical protein IBX50_05025 [Marinospirillum sp.]|uniref:hypothetical protein n=1 Tax=Marinospirillum sp. TaxID=2183934 RepID=UPI0019E81A19|nr:hypothetical protein [Marinospirillum sp.]MBE0506070.1 hypothetical protein [Marinospirillum sp.]